MQIGHYMQGIWEQGGISAYIRRVGSAQQAAGHKVHYLDTQSFNVCQNQAKDLLIVKDENDLFMQAKIHGLDILHLHTHVNLVAPRFVPIVRTVHNNNTYCPSGTRYLKQWSKPCNRAYSLSGCLWGHLIDHCGSLRPQKLKSEFQRTWQEMQTLNQIPVIANSQFVKDQMVRAGYDANNIRVLHLPAPEVRNYQPVEPEGIPHFLFLGRITPEKGWSWLLKALAEVKVPVHLDIAGAGNFQLEQAIRELAARLGLLEEVTFHGWVDEAKAMHLLQNARALIFPSVWHEPAGLVSLEAAAVGRAVIASNVGGIPEYVNRLQNALIVEPNNVADLAQTIEKLAIDSSLAQELGWRGRKFVKEQFYMGRHLQELMRIYKLTIEGFPLNKVSS